MKSEQAEKAREIERWAPHRPTAPVCARAISPPARPLPRKGCAADGRSKRRLRKIKEDEEAETQRRHEEGLRRVAEKKAAEAQALAEERAAAARTRTEGLLCAVKDARGVVPEVQVRVPLVDAVGFAATAAHLKSQLRAAYPGQPPESRQRLVHRGAPVPDGARLAELAAAMEGGTREPLPFFLVVAAAPAPAPATASAAAPAAAAPASESAAAVAPVRVRVKLMRGHGEAGPSEHEMTLSAAASVADVKAGLADAAPPAGVRLVFAGRVASDSDTLAALLALSADKTTIAFHAVAAQSVPASPRAASPLGARSPGPGASPGRSPR